jgi:dTMP kinase
VEVFREPGSTALAETLRTVWRDPELDVVDPITATLLMFAARRDTIEQSLRPYLLAQPQGLALLDRSFWSTLVYQNQTSPALLETLVRIICADMIPVRTYLLDLDPQIALLRRERMSDLDRFDTRGLDWHEGIRARYLELAQTYPDLFCIIEAILDDLLPYLSASRVPAP